MKNTLATRLSTAALFFLFGASLVSCSKEDLSPEFDATGRKIKNPTPIAGTVSSTDSSTPTTGTATPTTGSTTTSYAFNLNWSGRPDGAYGYNEAQADFKNSVYWSAYNSTINGGRLKTVMGNNLVGPVGGAMSKFDVQDGTAYQLQFDMMFDNNFEWSLGGKLGFGFLIGEGNTGNVPGWEGNGGSARLMWYKGWDGRVYFKPYAYYKDQPLTYGDDFGKTYPATGSIQRGVWYTVKIYVKSNTGSNTDGRFTMVINGTTLIDQPIRWTTNDLQRMVKQVCFENFRGGADVTWQSTTDGTIYFNNVGWSAL
jgi:hypothetical protein